MTRTLLLALSLTTCISAQVTHLESDWTGEKLYFTTYLRPIGSDHSDADKSYVWTRQGVALFADDVEEPEHAWRVARVSLSQDETVVGVSIDGTCYIQTGCREGYYEYSELRLPTGSQHFEGHIDITNNGDFAQLTLRTGFAFGIDPERLNRQVTRVRIGETESPSEPLGTLPAGRGRWMADDGTVLSLIFDTAHDPIYNPATWELNRPNGEIIPLGLALYPSAAYILPDASAVLIQFNTGGDSGPIEFLYPGGHRVPLNVEGRLLDLSADGSTMLYQRSTGERVDLFRMRLPAGREEIITTLPRVDLATISGDGSVAYAYGAHTIFRFDGTGGRPIIGPLPEMERLLVFGQRPYLESFVRGSTYRHNTAGFVEESTVAPRPAGYELDGVRASLGGVPLAIVRTEPDFVAFQVPWDAPHTVSPQLTIQSLQSGWEAAIMTSGIVNFEPDLTILGPTDEDGIAVHGDFRGPITRSDPAKPGEYVSVYATGLGPVNNQPLTGHVSPQSPLASMLTLCDWRYRSRYSDSGTADVLYAGLAPGAIGYYQIVWRLPEQFESNELILQCSGRGSAVRIPVQPPERELMAPHQLRE